MFDADAYTRKIDDERRRYRRLRKLDLQWSIICYCGALGYGIKVALFDPYGTGALRYAWAILALAWTIGGQIFLDSYLTPIGED